MTKVVKKIKPIYLIIFSIIFIIISILIFFIGKKFNRITKSSNVEKVQTVDYFKYFIDFESERYLGPNSLLTNTKALSGKQCGLIDKNTKYGPAVIIPVPTNDTSEISDIIVKFWVNPSTIDINVSMVFSVIDQNNNQVYWNGYPIKGDSFAIDNWYSFTCKFTCPKEFINTSYSFKFYLLNNDIANNPVYIDDMSVSLKETTSIESPRSKLIDFEELNDPRISSKYAKSGYYSTYAEGVNGFSASITIPFKDMDIRNINSLSLSFNYLSETSNLDAVFVVAVCDSTNKDVLWQGIDLSKAGFKEKVWETANGSILIPEDVAKPGNSIKVYLWNRNENKVFLDDVYLVIKEKNLSNDSLQPAFNLMSEKKYQAKANHPPYDFLNVTCQKFSATSNTSLNKIFTKNSRVLSGRFNKEISKDLLFCNQAGKNYLMSFENNEIVYNEVKFSEEIIKNSEFYTDNGYLFVCSPNSEMLNIYQFNPKKNEFVKVHNIAAVPTSKIIAITNNSDNSFSVFLNDGNILTYISKGEFVLGNKCKPVNPNLANIKFQKADFFNKKKAEVLLIYLEKEQNKYVFLSYDSVSGTWVLSNNHNNKSVQSFDKLDFASDYFVVDYNKSGQKEVLQFNKTKRFDLRLINFDMLTYNILFNIEFRGFLGKQNPKYYEVSKIVSGDFIGDDCSEIIIFQDNISKVDWLTQKTEMYSFSK